MNRSHEPYIIHPNSVHAYLQLWALPTKLRTTTTSRTGQPGSRLQTSASQLHRSTSQTVVQCGSSNVCFRCFRPVASKPKWCLGGYYTRGMMLQHYSFAFSFARSTHSDAGPPDVLQASKKSVNFDRMGCTPVLCTDQSAQGPLLPTEGLSTTR